ncbi:MAG TPA: hypothetical protein VFB38_03950 [Chthonomonadaceae bacterium]|nr:hypothetical protein [Chthonomonadaceae bacterium]
MSETHCEYGKPILAPAQTRHPMTRRSFMQKALMTATSISALDFLSYFHAYGSPLPDKTRRTAREAARANDNPHFLIYWYIEGGWESYDMFSPVVTPNNVIHRLPPDQISKETYRVLHFGEPGYGIYKQGNIRYGYLAEHGKNLFPDMAVLSSMETGEFHSGDRLRVHMGSYDLRLQADRQDDERSVMQAFAEVYGQPYVLPHLSWHYWLSDGELNEQQYTGRKGYYANLGPAWAHTIYAGTPANLKSFLLRMQAASSDTVNRQIEKFLDNMHPHLRRDADVEVIKSFDSACNIYESLASAGRRLDKGMLSRLFADPVLRAKFDIKPEDELITYTSVNGNKARTKFSPAVNVQAMMTYEMMRAGLSCAFFIETRNIREFDSHFDRRSLWEKDRRTPRGQPDQTRMMNEQLWKPLNTLVELLKATPYKNTGKSLFDFTTIVLTSEFGRTIKGDVDAILAMKIPEADKQKMIDGQDISQHWKVTSAAFLGGKVKGNSQYGGVGERTLLPIPLLPDGSLDPAYDPMTGELKPGRQKSPQSSIPDHGDVYATALYLSDIEPKGHGRNTRPPLRYIKKA